ncbi:MAG: hypothetical protein RSC49_01125 [Clostridium sp.]
MIDSQEIIERSVYQSLLNTTMAQGFTLDPNKYFPVSIQNSKKFETDKIELEKQKGFYVCVFGVGNNQSKGMKTTPRIVVDSQGFLPGDIGLPKSITEKVEGKYFVSEQSFEAIDQYIDIHLVAENQNQIRLLQNILANSIPQRGYIKPYTYDDPPFDGNIYIEASNFYQMPDNEKGIIEKVYQFIIKDTLLPTNTKLTELPKMVDVSLLLNNESFIHKGEIL